MGKAIRCECGELVRATSDKEVLAKAKVHIDTKHPDLVGKLTESDLLAMAEEV